MAPTPRTSLEEPESLHFCPQLEALQDQLRLLEVENEQLREEVRMWQGGAPAGRGLLTPLPLPLSLPLSLLPGLSTRRPGGGGADAHPGLCGAVLYVGL